MGGDSYLGKIAEHLVGYVGRGDGLRPVQVRAGVDGDRSWLKWRREIHLPIKETDRRPMWLQRDLW